MKQKGSSDVKGTLWNYLDKKVLLWHREAEAPLFLRVYQNKSHVKCNRRHSETSNLSICWASDQSTHPSTHSSSILQANHRLGHPSIKQHGNILTGTADGQDRQKHRQKSVRMCLSSTACAERKERDKEKSLHFHWAEHFSYILDKFRLS